MALLPIYPTFTIDSPWLENALAKIRDARVGVFGDLCLDAYWDLDTTSTEVSVETGLPIHRVRTQRYSPGGAGNVAANLAALCVKTVEIVGVIGEDAFGQELLRQFRHRDIPTQRIERIPQGWQTYVYAKPYSAGVELNRYDFGGGSAIGPEVEARLVAHFGAIVAACKVVIINQQIVSSWVGRLIPALNNIIGRNPQTLFIVDSRDYAGAFQNTALKLNVAEALRLVNDPVSGVPDDAVRLAAAIEAKQRRPVIVTRGEFGMALAAQSLTYDVFGIELPGAVDSVGAGDAALAAFAAASAADVVPVEAATFANLTAAITTRQVRTTGTATPDMLRAVGPAPDYICFPVLAEHSRRACYLPGTSIETVTHRRPPRRIRYAIFDHDGTISTLRQGWEDIMHPMMLRAILGDRIADVDDVAYARVADVVKNFIERTTGVQTLAQMKGLVGIVRDFGYVRPDQILDEHGYKAIYNRSLLEVVTARVSKLDRDELSADDFQIKKARQFMERLHASGAVLLLASGSDQDDVIREAQRLGYAHLFAGIYGSVGDLNIEAKRVVLDRIFRQNAIADQEVVVFGDGPVEIREARRRGAFAVGLATDEIRRHGLNERKRTRLVRAGAEAIIADFCELPALLEFLHIE